MQQSSSLPDPQRFFQDALNRQGLLIESSSLPLNLVSPLDLLSRDQLLSLWESCSPDESQPSRLSKAVALYLRDALVKIVAASQLSFHVPFPPSQRRLGVQQAVEFASLCTEQLCRLVLTT